VASGPVQLAHTRSGCTALAARTALETYQTLRLSHGALAAALSASGRTGALRALTGSLVQAAKMHALAVQGHPIMHPDTETDGS